MSGLKTNWTKDDFYNFEDLNRVEEWTKTLNEKHLLLRGENFSFVHVLNRTEKSIETADSLNRIENNIKVLRVSLNRPKGSVEPKLSWKSIDVFDFNDANRLEKNLLVLFNYLQGNLTNLKYCGTYTVGSEGVV